QPVAPANSFSTAMINGGESSDTIGPFDNTTGIDQTIQYHCSFHPNMKGTLIIKSVPVTPFRDLVMSDVSFSGGQVAPGAMLSVNNAVENQGTLAAGAFIVAYRLSADTIYGNGDDVVITTTRSVKSLGAGANSPATTSLLIPKTAPGGDYYICAKADSANKV